MEKNNLVVVIMGQDSRDFLELCLESVKDADAIVYCDGGSKDDSRLLAVRYGAEVIVQEFDQEDPLMNGKQRNFYLDYLKTHFLGWRALALDADEVLSDGGVDALRELGLSKDDVPYVASVRMRHLVHNLSLEDSSQEVHYVPHRFFVVHHDLFYPEGEHVILQAEEHYFHDRLDVVVAWHLAYAPLFHLRRRYLKNLSHSNVHTKEFLERWYRLHLFGQYPSRRIDVRDLPETLLKGFCIDKDELYFQGRGLEPKHFIDVVDWKRAFAPESVLELGAGLGPRVYAMRMLGLDAFGMELSHWAVEHGLAGDGVFQGDITEKGEWPDSSKFDLVVAYDVFEHLSYDGLVVALRMARSVCKKRLLVSVPVVGDPNLEADPTHVIKESREWWVSKIVEHGFRELPVPEDFLYREQLMLFEVE